MQITTKYNIPKPDKKYAPLPLDAEAKLISFQINTGGMNIETILSDAGLVSSYYKWQELGNKIYQVIGHYTCPP